MEKFIMDGLVSVRCVAFQSLADCTVTHTRPRPGRGSQPETRVLPRHLMVRSIRPRWRLCPPAMPALTSTVSEPPQQGNNDDCSTTISRNGAYPKPPFRR